MNIKSISIGAIALGLLLSGCFQEPQYVHVGPNWERLHNMTEGENSFKVRLISAPAKVELGKPMRFTLQSAQAGQLWVVQVDPSDELSLLFPNPLQRDNRIKADIPVSIPPADGGWSLEAAEPAGPSAIAFFVTPDGVSLEEALGGGDNSKRMENAIAVVGQARAWGLAKTVVEVTEPAESMKGYP